MDTRNLKQFVTLAETLHFGRASDACHVSPSALSRSIRQLEEEVGARLFDRDNRSVQLTRQGERFLDYARDSLSQWDAVRNQLMEEAGELSGDVSVYCSVTASYSFLFDLLSELRREHPRIEIKLHTGDPEDAVRRVMAAEEDIAIGARPDTLPGGLAFKSIQTSPLLFIAAREQSEHVRLSGRPPEPDEWAATPMILSESGSSRRRVDAWFAGLGIQPAIYAQVAETRRSSAWSASDSASASCRASCWTTARSRARSGFSIFIPNWMSMTSDCSRSKRSSKAR